MIVKSCVCTCESHMLSGLYPGAARGGSLIHALLGIFDLPTRLRGTAFCGMTFSSSVDTTCRKKHIIDTVAELANSIKACLLPRRAERRMFKVKRGRYLFSCPQLLWFEYGRWQQFNSALFVSQSSVNQLCVLVSGEETATYCHPRSRHHVVLNQTR